MSMLTNGLRGRNEIYIRGPEFELSRQLASDQPQYEDQRLEIYNQVCNIYYDFRKSQCIQSLNKKS